MSHTRVSRGYVCCVRCRTLLNPAKQYLRSVYHVRQKNSPPQWRGGPVTQQMDVQWPSGANRWASELYALPRNGAKPGPNQDRIKMPGRSVGMALIPYCGWVRFL